MMAIAEQEVQWTADDMVEVSLGEPDDFSLL